MAVTQVPAMSPLPSEPYQAHGSSTTGIQPSKIPRPIAQSSFSKPRSELLAGRTCQIDSKSRPPTPPSSASSVTDSPTPPSSASSVTGSPTVEHKQPIPVKKPSKLDTMINSYIDDIPIGSAMSLEARHEHLAIVLNCYLEKKDDQEFYKPKSLSGAELTSYLQSKVREIATTPSARAREFAKKDTASIKGRIDMATLIQHCDPNKTA